MGSCSAQVLPPVAGAWVGARRRGGCANRTLYGIEGEIRGRSPDQRREVRPARARPQLDSLQRWLQANIAKLSKMSMAAVGDRLPSQHLAMRYYDDGALEIDNNAAERALRAAALAKELSVCRLRCERRARRSDLRLIGSAKLNESDPEASGTYWLGSLITTRSTALPNSCPGISDAPPRPSDRLYRIRAH